MSERLTDRDIEAMIVRLREASARDDPIVDVDKTHIPGGLLFGVHAVSGNRAGLLRLSAAVLHAAVGPQDLKQDAMIRAAEPLDAILAEHSDRLIFARRDDLAAEVSRKPTKAATAVAIGSLTFFGALVPFASYALMLIGAYAVIRWIVSAVAA